MQSASSKSFRAREIKKKRVWEQTSERDMKQSKF